MKNRRKKNDMIIHFNIIQLQTNSLHHYSRNAKNPSFTQTSIKTLSTFISHSLTTTKSKAKTKKHFIFPSFYAKTFPDQFACATTPPLEYGSSTAELSGGVKSFLDFIQLSLFYIDPIAVSYTHLTLPTIYSV